MKKVLQSLKTGKTEAVDVPVPNNRSGNLLIQSSTSLISAGTEKMLLEFGKAGLINKAFVLFAAVTVLANDAV